MRERNEFQIGVNYWPRETAMLWWRRFDPSVVKRDFSLLADYRFDVIRIFLLWEDFQPESGRISVPALNHLVQVAETAYACKLRILSTLFTGHMSGINWLPSWMLESGPSKTRFSIFSEGELRSVGIRNMYADREVWKAQKLFLHEITGALQGHPAVWGWDLGNEPSKLVLPPSKDAALAWLEEMATELKRYDSGIPVTLGLNQEDLEEDRVLGPRDVAQFCDILSIHAYPGYATWAESPLDEMVPLFLLSLAAWLGEKEVLLEEFGIPTEPTQAELSQTDRAKLDEVHLASEDQADTYYGKVLELLIANGFPGAVAWCFSDYEPALWDTPPLADRVHERYFGLFRWDGSAKGPAKMIAAFDRRGRRGELPWDWVDIKREEYYERPREHMVRLYHRFKDRFQQG